MLVEFIVLDVQIPVCEWLKVLKETNSPSACLPVPLSLGDKLPERLPARYSLSLAGGLGQPHKVCRHLCMRDPPLQVLTLGVLD